MPTGNVCAPGLLFMQTGKLIYSILNSSSKTHLKNKWVTGVADAYGDSLIRHIINGDTVLTYTKTMIGEGFVSTDFSWAQERITDSMFWINKANTPLKEGSIALQARATRLTFRNIELPNPEGCIDSKAKNYKNY